MIVVRKSALPDGGLDVRTGSQWLEGGDPEEARSSCHPVEKRKRNERECDPLARSPSHPAETNLTYRAEPVWMELRNA